MVLELSFYRLVMELCELRLSAHDDEQVEYQQQRHIPYDLLTDNILTRLPIKSLLHLKCVSKYWYSAISSPRFGNAHFKFSPLSQPSCPTQCVFIQIGHDFYLYCYDDDDDIGSYYGSKGLVKLNCEFDVKLDELIFVGSCNGLVCLASISGCFIIWNPITHQFRKVSDPDLNPSKIHTISWGFGYASSIDDYKIIKIIHLDTLEIVVHVFSLRINEWRRIDHETLKSPLLFLTHRGVLVNKTLYWLVDIADVQKAKILSFDLDLEVFDTFYSLGPMRHGVDNDDLLCVMGGCLALCRPNMRGEVHITMFKCPGEVKSAFLCSSFRLSSCNDGVGFTRTGRFFVMDRSYQELGLIDPRKWPLEYTSLVRFPGNGVINMANHVPSLISPFAGAENELLEE